MKNRNITIKKLIVVALAIVLITVCISSSTFSWFNRPSSQDLNGSTSGTGTGKAMQLNVPQSNYYLTSIAENQRTLTTTNPKAYDGGDVTIATYLSSDDGVSFADEPADPQTSGSIDANDRIYYLTTITNGSETEQNVSLYIKNFAPGGETGSNLCVGTNVPVKSFKNYSMYGVTIPAPTKNLWNGETKRVYFEPYGAIPSQSTTSIYGDVLYKWRDSLSSKHENERYYVCSGSATTDIESNDGSAGTWKNLQKTSFSGSDIYWVDIPWDHNKLYFVTADWNTHSDKSRYRTQTFSNLSGDGLSMTQSLRFYLAGNYTSDYDNAYAGKAFCVGANFASYYDSVTIAGKTDQTIDISLSDSQVSSNANPKVSYSSSDTDAFTVSNAGVITAKAVSNTTTASLTYTVTSEYGDTNTATCSVKVNKFSTSTDTIEAAPIVTNLLIPAGGKQDVYWFIQNGDQMYGEADETGTYTLDGIYLGL